MGPLDVAPFVRKLSQLAASEDAPTAPYPQRAQKKHFWGRVEQGQWRGHEAKRQRLEQLDFSSAMECLAFSKEPSSYFNKLAALRC